MQVDDLSGGFLNWSRALVCATFSNFLTSSLRVSELHPPRVRQAVNNAPDPETAERMPPLSRESPAPLKTWARRQFDSARAGKTCRFAVKVSRPATSFVLVNTTSPS